MENLLMTYDVGGYPVPHRDSVLDLHSRALADDLRNRIGAPIESNWPSVLTSVLHLQIYFERISRDGLCLHSAGGHEARPSDRQVCGFCDRYFADPS